MLWCLVFPAPHPITMGNITGRLCDGFLQRIAFAPPSSATYSSRDVHFVKSLDGLSRVAVWLTGPKDCKDTLENYNSLRPLILLSHGNAEDIGGVAQYCKALAENCDCNVLTYDYVNYGQSSPGVTNETNLHASISAVYDYAVTELRARSIIVMGKSIGTAPSVFIAAERCNHVGVILVSPLASGARTLSLSVYLPAKMLKALDRVFCPSVNTIQYVTKSVLIFHGNQDKIIPVQNAYDLLSNVPSSLRENAVFYGTAKMPVGHNDIETLHGEDFYAQIAKFTRKCVEKSGEDVYLAYDM